MIDLSMQEAAKMFAYEGLYLTFRIVSMFHS